MSGQTQRLNVVPTVTILGLMKARLVGATRGHALLKKKSDALTVQFRQILKKIVFTKESMGDIMKTSSFALTEAKYVAGDNIKHVVLENVREASLKVRSRQENVAGVKLPKFEYTNDGEVNKNDLTGLARGGQQVQQCRAAYIKAIEVLVELASLQTSFLTLDEAIKTTNRRVNALENVVKPRLENTISYIKGELDVLEREDFFRLKKIQGYKKREIEKQMQSAKLFAEEQVAEKLALQRAPSSIAQAAFWRLGAQTTLRLAPKQCTCIQLQRPSTKHVSPVLAPRRPAALQGQPDWRLGAHSQHQRAKSSIKQQTKLFQRLGAQFNA
ncbi:hypothetical protein PIB30_026398 [Stylosanthes scabra]|uniref:V-type proton ATPase subunit D n=1 Tax=Stylosanthes scabra TaxID=79078 RepID=A0ABU6SB22_9FABA|nr:hypothetical protein [Stylosanthes scabra]